MTLAVFSLVVGFVFGISCGWILGHALDFMGS